MVDEDILQDARTLAAFSNLTPEDAEYFRHNYPGFVPDYWWQAVYFQNAGFRGDFAIAHSPPINTDEKAVWRLWEKFLRESWTKLSPDRIIALLTRWASRAAESSETEVAGVDIPIAYPYQRAVMFLALEPWRAAFCEKCGQRFVKEKPARRYCSDTCFQESRKASKRELWAKHGSEWLENRKRPKTSRRSRPNAKGKGLHQR